MGALNLISFGTTEAISLFQLYQNIQTLKQAGMTEEQLLTIWNSITESVTNNTNQLAQDAGIVDNTENANTENIVNKVIPQTAQTIQKS
ncbi:MAG: hypothetical protein QXI16_00270 [Sulfolobaceae archaeon]